MKIKKLAVAMGLGIGLAAGAATAAPINLGQWYTFGFGGPASDLSSGVGFITGQQSQPAPDAPWTFDCRADHCKITITDGFQAGDEFRLFDFGNPIGDTGAVATDGSNSCGNDEVACLASPGHSDGIFVVGPGAHSITGIVSDSPFDGGAGFIRVDIPEPGTLALLGLALAGFGLRRIRS